MTNIVVAQLIKNAGSLCYGPCHYELDNKFIKTTLGDFAISQFSKTNQSVRDLDWIEHISVLENFIKYATLNNKFLIFGSHRNDQIHNLKKIYQSDIVTISVNYSEDNYSFLIRNMAEYHVHLLRNNHINPTDSDIQLLKSKSDLELINYFSNEFSNLNLVPSTCNIAADYNISINDLKNKSAMANHFELIGLPFTKQSEIFYDTWLNLQYN